MEENLNFIPLLLVLLLAFAVPLLLSRFRAVPVVVGEIVAGVIIGPSVLGLLGEGAPLGGLFTLEVMSNIGLAFLMFLAGMEIDFNRLIPARNREGQASEPNVLGMSAVVYLLTLGLAIPSGFFLNQLGLEGNPWLLAFILSATSLGVALPVLKQRGLTHTLTGQSIFITALLADFITVLLLTIYIITLDRGLDLEVFSIVLLFVFFFMVYRIGYRIFRFRQMRVLFEELSHVTVQIKVRGAIAILMAFVVLAGILGVELILGAFLAGMVISLLKAPEDTDLVHKLEAFGFGFFIPVFFILTGVNLDLRSFLESPQSWLLLPVLFLIALAVKTLPALLFKRWLSWRETLAGAVLLNTHLSLEIAVAVIGARLGLLSPAANAAVILFAVLTVLIMPVLFNALIPPLPAKPKRTILLFGAEDLGLQVAKILEKHGERVRFLEPEPHLVNQARRIGFETIQATSIVECLEAASQDYVEALLVLSSDDTRNLLVSHAAVNRGIENVVALVNHPSRLSEYRSLGVNAFTTALYRPALLALMARSPDILTLLTSTTDEQDVREVTLNNPLAEGEPLRSLSLPGTLLVLSIGRDGDLIIPHGNTRLQAGDRLTIIGNIEDVQDAALWLENSHPRV